MTRCFSDVTPCWLTAALAVLWSLEYDRVEDVASGGDGFTAAMYADAAVQLLDSKHHVVPKRAMAAVLGRHVLGDATDDTIAVVAAGKIALQRLVEANALSVRLYSQWAQDVPAEAFVNSSDVVTAPSTTALYCMRRMRPELDLALRLWSEKKP
jgi:hypothetical protein